MPIEASCPSCGGKFRVPDAAAGKKVRCPKCKEPMPVPAAAAVSSPAQLEPRQMATKPAAPKAARKAEMWFLKSEEGDDFGPVSRSELDEWHGEGRITADCQLLRQGSEQWQWASDIYPALDASDDAADDAAAQRAPAEPALPAFGIKTDEEVQEDEPDEPAAPV